MPALFAKARSGHHSDAYNADSERTVLLHMHLSVSGIFAVVLLLGTDALTAACVINWAVQ